MHNDKGSEGEEVMTESTQEKKNKSVSETEVGDASTVIESHFTLWSKTQQ